MDMLEKLLTEVNEEDFLIRVRPFANDEVAWSGKLISQLWQCPITPMDDEDYYQGNAFC